MTGWEILGLAGAAMTLTSFGALIVIVIVRPRRDEAGHTVYLIERDDPVFAYQLDEAVRRYQAGARG